MGDLLVWVNGLSNTISGLDASTTTREIVVALAQSYRFLGCFNLIEKTPAGERYLHPNEHPLKLLQKWGQNSPNCFILRKKVLSPTSSRPSSSGSQSSPVRTRLVEVASLSGLSSGPTSDSKRRSQGPPIVKPKPKPKPKSTLEASTGEMKPIPVPRKRISVSPSTIKKDDFQQSWQQPDVLIKTKLPGHSSESKPLEQQHSTDHSKPTEDERLKQNQERLSALEIQRQQQEQVEKALKEKRNRGNRTKGYSGDERREEVYGQRQLKKLGRQVGEDELKTPEVERLVEVEHQNEVQSVRTRTQDESRRQEDAKKLKELEEVKRLDNERKQKEGRERDILEQKKKEKLDRQKEELEKKKRAEEEENKKRELEDRKRQERERVQSLKLKQLAEQREKQRQEELQQELKKKELERKEIKRKEMERKRRQQEEEKDKLREAKRKAEKKRREEERKKAIEEEEKQKLADLVKAQECKLNHQQSQLTGLDVAIQSLLKFENDPAIDRIREEVSNIEQSIQTNQALLNEKDFWDNELDLEREMHKTLEASVGVLKEKVADCNRQISQKETEIINLTKTIKKEEKLVMLDQEQAEEVKAVKEELNELKHEYSVITANLVNVNERLIGLDEDFQEKQKVLKLTEENYGRDKTKELRIIIPDNKTESNDGKDSGPASPTSHRILKGSPRQLAQATPSTDNPEGVFL